MSEHDALLGYYHRPDGTLEALYWDAAARAASEEVTGVPALPSYHGARPSVRAYLRHRLLQTAAERDRYRAALQAIVAVEPTTRDCDECHLMIDVARAALEVGG